jgi:hypothetical protein
MNVLTDALKKVNNVPIKFSIKHYYPFESVTEALKDNKLDSGESWDTLRAVHPDFSISPNRDEWLKASELEIRKDGQDSALKKRAQEVVRLIDSEKITALFSVGVGGAGLEYQIKKIRPSLKVTCSEYSQKTVDILKKVFLEADSIIQFDITTKNWPYLGKSELCMIYRIDASFTDREWRVIFQNMYDSGVENVIYIPTTFLTIFSFFIRMKRRISWILSGKKFAFSGYVRTKRSFQGFWESLYTEEVVELGGVKSFYLKKK